MTDPTLRKLAEDVVNANRFGEIHLPDAVDALTDYVDSHPEPARPDAARGNTTVNVNNNNPRYQGEPTNGPQPDAAFRAEVKRLEREYADQLPPADDNAQPDAATGARLERTCPTCEWAMPDCSCKALIAKLRADLAAARESRAFQLARAQGAEDERDAAQASARHHADRCAALVQEVEGLRAALSATRGDLEAITHCPVCNGAFADLEYRECHEDCAPPDEPTDAPDITATFARIDAALAIPAAPVRTADVNVVCPECTSLVPGPRVVYELCGHHARKAASRRAREGK